MTLPLLTGTLSFAAMAASDFCCLRGHTRWARLLFLAGCGALCAATVRLLWISPREALGGRAIFPVLALGSLALLVYSVFFAVRPSPEDRLACPPDKQPLQSRGMYALCRHPGVLWLGAFYGSLALTWHDRQWLLAFGLFTGADALYVLYQDRAVFPHTIHRYRAYQKETPFLIPTVSSIKRMLAPLRQSERNKGQ